MHQADGRRPNLHLDRETEGDRVPLVSLDIDKVHPKDRRGEDASCGVQDVDGVFPDGNLARQGRNPRLDEERIKLPRSVPVDSTGNVEDVRERGIHGGALQTGCRQWTPSRREAVE